MRWTLIDTDPLMVLHAKLQLVKNNYLTCQLHYSSDGVIREKKAR